MIQSEDTYLLLFSFCKVVKGAEKSVICDFQKGKIKFIPHEMEEVIRMLQKQPLNAVRKYFKEDNETFESYIKFLIDEGFVFYNKSKEEFLEIKNQWSSPEIINNAIIEYNFDNFSLKDILNQLDSLLAKFIEIRFTTFSEKNLEELKDILKNSTHSVLRSVRLYFPYISKNLSKEIIEVTDFPIIDCIVFYGYVSNKSIEKDTREIFFITQTLKEISNSNIDRKFLINNIDHFYECQKHNPYYNKKVAINSLGEIKNCIKNKAVFGNVKTNFISEVVSNKNFQELWYATHDQIIGVQNSELRYNYIITNDLEKLSDGTFKIV